MPWRAGKQPSDRGGDYHRSACANAKPREIGRWGHPARRHPALWRDVGAREPAKERWEEKTRRNSIAVQGNKPSFVQEWIRPPLRFVVRRPPDQLPQWDHEQNTPQLER